MTLFTAIAAFLLLGVQTGKPTDFVVMQFSAKWCEPCQEMQPSMENLSQNGWIIRNVDVDSEKSIVQRMKITHLPTLVILRNGQEVDRITGVHSLQELRNLLPSPNPNNEDRISRSSTSNPARASTESQALAPFPMLETSPRRTENSVPSSAPPITATKTTQDSIQPNTAFLESSQTRSQTLPEVRPNTTAIDPMSTTVRIRTEDDNHISFGTGTMIDQMNGEVLVLTCGHLFREFTASTRIIVEAPVNGQLGQFAGTVVDYQCDATDIGLLSFKPGVAVPVAPLVPKGTLLTEGEPVASFGCDGGADPTRRDSRITKLNRYLGPSNVEVAEAPVQGRSGGGLFNQAGQLIGVCYAADKELNEGLYSGPEVVYNQLARLGLTRLYSKPDGNNNSIANQPGRDSEASLAITGAKSANDVFPDQMKMNNRSVGRSNINSQVQQTVQQTVDQASQIVRSNTAAIASASAALQPTSSITATIRDSSGRERTVNIPNAPTALLQMLDTVPQTAQNNSSAFTGTASMMR